MSAEQTAPRAVVVGSWHDSGGVSGEAYGPFDLEAAESTAEALTDGGWKYLRWSAVPLAALPGQGEPVPS